MSATPVYTDKAAQPIKTPTAIYCSGQIPWDRDGNLVEGTIQEKTAACISSLKVVLEEAGSSIEKVVKVNVFLTDMANFASMNEEYAKWFTHKPARSCVAVKQLPKGVDMIMTPLIMISFLVSLAIIDLKYSIRRSSFHGDPSPPASSSSSSGTNHTRQTTSWVPSWLERQLCKLRPYRYVVGCPPCEDRKRNDSEHHQHEPEQWNGIWGTSFYRTKQRTLMKMEAADAFEIRTKTLAALVVLSLFLLWCTWRLLSWVVCFIWSML
ncbi:Endoribonuclease L-PSP domain containing protein [Rhypophila sp. PSN 637]